MNALLNYRTFLINFYMGKIAHQKKHERITNQKWY